MKGRRAWKKALAGVLTGALLIGTLSTVSASTSVSDVDASGWWVSHSEGILLEDGIKTTITFTGITYDTASGNWNTPIYVVYTADDDFYGGAGISDTAGYTEYYVMRADVYGWEGAGSLGASYETISAPADWATWLTESKAGMEGTITATLDDSTLTVDYVYGDAETVATITVDTSKPVYLSLTGEECEVTDISYDVENAKTFSYLTGSITDVQIGDRFSMNGRTITLVFADESTAEATFDSYGECICKGYHIEYDAYTDSEDDYCISAAVLASGDYNAYFYIYDCNWNYINTCSFSFTVGDLYASSLNATALTLGGSESVTLSDGADSQWYYYTCAEDDLCLFISSDNSTVDEDGDYDYYNTFGILYTLNEDGTLSYVDYDSNSGDENYNFAIKYSLKKDTTYYLQARLYNTTSTEGASYTISLIEAKNIASISIDNLGETTFTQFEDYLDEDGTSLIITYEDGSTETVTVNGSYALSSNLDYFYYYIEDSSTGYKYWSYENLYINPGIYTIYFYTYNADDEMIQATATVEVVSVNFTTIVESGTKYTTDTEGFSYAWYTYTPSEDGEYYFPLTYTADSAATYSEAFLNNIMYVNEDGDFESLGYAYDEDGDRITTEIDGVTYDVYKLEAGTIYYIQTYFWAETEIYDSETDDYDYVGCAGTVTLSANKVGETYSEDNTEENSEDNSETGTEENSEGGSEDASDSESTEDTDSEDADSEDADSEDTDSEDAESEDTGSAAADSDDSGSDAATTTLAETTLTSATAWSAITTSDLTVSGDSTTTYTVTIDEAYGDDWFSVEVYDGDGNYITLNSDGTYWYYGTEGDDIVMTGSAITLEEGATYTVEIVRDGSDFTVTFYDEEGNELLSYYAANTNIDETAATHVYAQVGSYTVSGEATGTAASLDTTGEDSGETTDDGDSNANGGSSASATNSVITTGSSTVSGSPKTGDASLLLLALMAAFGCMVTAISCKKKFLG